LSEDLATSFEPILFRHISKHSKSLLKTIASNLRDENMAKQTLFTFVKIAKFFFKENFKSASSDLTSILCDDWNLISSISESSKENLLFTVHLIKHLFLLDRGRPLQVTSLKSWLFKKNHFTIGLVSS
jgi:hypothetical protein